MKKSGLITDWNWLLPSDFRKEGLCSTFCANMNEIFINIHLKSHSIELFCFVYRCWVLFYIATLASYAWHLKVKILDKLSSFLRSLTDRAHQIMPKTKFQAKSGWEFLWGSKFDFLPISNFLNTGNMVLNLVVNSMMIRYL